MIFSDDASSNLRRYDQRSMIDRHISERLAMPMSNKGNGDSHNVWNQHFALRDAARGGVSENDQALIRYRPLSKAATGSRRDCTPQRKRGDHGKRRMNGSC